MYAFGVNLLGQYPWAKKRKRLKASSKKLNIEGSKDHEKIIGNRKGNALVGGKGDDILDGRGGDDVLTGGPGADFFVISSGRDQITDFNPAEGDQIVHRGPDEIIRFPVSGGTLLATLSGIINTTVSNIKPAQIALSSQQRLKPSFKVVFESGDTVRLESAESDFQQSLGMMQREALLRRRGMMFPQSKAQKKSIYMFNCLAPLDILLLTMARSLICLQKRRSVLILTLMNACVMNPVSRSIIGLNCEVTPLIDLVCPSEARLI